MDALINDRKLELHSSDQLASLIDDMMNDDPKELWIKREDQRSLCVITNHAYVFFMYLRYDGDSGFRSDNPSADENRMQEFKLSNGQVDQYPETWVVDKESVKRVILTYVHSGEMDPSIAWIDV